MFEIKLALIAANLAYFEFEKRQIKQLKIVNLFIRRVLSVESDFVLLFSCGTFWPAMNCQSLGLVSHLELY